MMSVMTSCCDWLISTPAETKVEPFGLSLWSQRKTDSKSEMSHCVIFSRYQKEEFRDEMTKAYLAERSHYRSTGEPLRRYQRKSAHSH